MDVKRILSRSIIIDRVTERVQKERYLKHVASLNKIQRSISKAQFILAKQREKQYEKRLQEMKKSRSYVQSLFNAKAIQNETLAKRMEQIDRRKNYHSEDKRLPAIKLSRSRSRQDIIKRENQQIVERIIRERKAKSKEKITAECKAYQKYRENLRKIKGTASNKRKLYLIR